MSPKNGCNNLYYHPFSLFKRQKLFSYLTSFSRRGPVNRSTPNFPNINLTRTIANLPVVSNVTKKMAVIISITTHSVFLRDRNCFLI